MRCQGTRAVKQAAPAPQVKQVIDPMSVFAGDRIALPEAENDWRFLRFRPPQAAREGAPPHIRLDRAMQFLIGDKLA